MMAKANPWIIWAGLIAVLLMFALLSQRNLVPESDNIYEGNVNFAERLSALCDAEFSADGPFGRMTQRDFVRTRALHHDQKDWNQLLLMQLLLMEGANHEPDIRSQASPDDFRFDWADRGAVSTEVHDQGSLGTCAAFATTGNIEAQRVIHGDGVLEPLSVEQIVECSAEQDTANDEANCGVFGGWPKLVLQYVRKHGLATASEWPYCSGTLDRKLSPLCFPCMPQSYSQNICDDHDDDFYCNAESTIGQRKVNGFCKSDSSFRPKVHIDDFKVLDDAVDEEILKAHLEKYGPLAVTISIGPLQLYRKGILDPPDFICPRKGRPGKYLPSKATDNVTNNSVDHVVLLTGYGAENGKQYWRFKNSWGPKWGEKGYFRLRRGVNSCGVGRFEVATAIGVKTMKGETETDRIHLRAELA